MFKGREHCLDRLNGWGFKEGIRFVTTKNRASDNPPNYVFSCMYHGKESINTRKLGAQVVRSEEGEIVSDRKRATVDHRLDCLVKYKLSYLLVNKDDNSGERHWIGKWTHDIHVNTHAVPEDPLTIGYHRNQTASYQRVVQQARIYRQCELPYSQARKLLDAANIGVRIKAKDYYNLVRGEAFKRDERSAWGLLKAFEDAGFRYAVMTEMSSRLQRMQYL